jgi:peptidoglycan/xylan/chitin deacetylase (PgdA/CDA1 family)
MFNRANLHKSVRQFILGGIGSLIPSFTVPGRQAQITKKLLVLCYHNIVVSSHNEDSCDDYYFLNLPQNIFEKQIRWVSKNFEIIRLDDLIRGAPIPSESALITFDDGFKSVYSSAFPVLKSLKVPATIFLTGAHINEKRVPWISHLHYIIDNGYPKSNTIEIDKNYYNLSERSEKVRLLSSVKTLLKEKNYKDISKVLSELEKKLDIYLPHNVLLENFLSKQEIDELSDHGWTIGNHTYNHVNLNCLGSEEVTNEIVYAQRALRQFKQYRDVLAIPFGDSNSFSRRVIDIAHRNGISYIFTTRGGFKTFHSNNRVLDRIICDTFSFSYFKFLAKGKKSNIENIIKHLSLIRVK